MVWNERSLIVCALMIWSMASGLELLTLPWQKPGTHLRDLLCILAYAFIAVPFRVYTNGVLDDTPAAMTLLSISSCVLLLYVLGYRWRQILLIMLLTFFIAVIGDTAALSLVMFSDIYVYGSWNAPGGLAPYAVTNLLQPVISLGASLILQRWIRSRSRIKQGGTETDIPDQSLLYPILGMQVILIVHAFLLAKSFGYRSYTYHPFLVVQGTLAFGTSAWLVLAWRDRELAQLKEQEEKLRRRNKEAFAVYQAMERQYADVRRMEHDIRNQLQTAEWLYQSGGREEADRLIGEIEKRLAAGPTQAG